MEIMLLEDVLKLGKRGEVVKVSVGYARNFLIPHKLAVKIDAANKKMLDNERRRLDISNRKRVTEQKELSAKLNVLEIEISARANDGKLYGSVSSADIVKRLSEHGVVIEPSQIMLDEHIKSVGIHSVPIRLKEGMQANVTIHVIASE